MRDKDYVKPGHYVSFLKERAQFTPDFSELRWWHSMTVMVYDELQHGMMHNKAQLEGAEYFGSGLTLSKNFQMRKINPQRPIVFESDKDSLLSRHLRGDVFMVNVEHIHVLDRYYLNNVNYRRIITRVWLPKMPYGLKVDSVKFFQGHPWIHCFVYVAKEVRWQNTVLSMQPVKHYVGNDDSVFKNRPYYSWDWMDSSYPDDDPEELGRYSWLAENGGVHVG